MKQALLLFAFISLMSFAAIGQTTAKAVGMGSLTSIQTDAHSLFNNPAGLTDFSDVAFLVNAEQFYLVDGINKSSIGAAIPTSSGTFGITAYNFGFSDFRQQRLGIVYARKLLGQLNIGAQINYFQTRIPEYGSNGQLSFELGLQAKLTKDILIGACLTNPYQTGDLENAETPALFRMGMAYFVSEKITTGIELEKDIDFPIRVKFGLEYKFLGKLFLRTGFSSNPTNFHLGVGLQVNDKLMIDIGNKYDPTLGLTPSVSISYILGKN